MSKRISALLLCLFLFCLLIVFQAAGCGQNSSSGSGEEPPVFSPLKVLVPEAPGTDTIGYSPLILDISNISQGYLTAVSDSNGTTKNIQLSADDGVVYSYFVSSGESAVIPFTSGSGTYQISCYEQVNGSQYAALFAQALEVSLENEFLPFFPCRPPVFNSLVLNYVDYIKGMSLFREIYFLERRNSFANP